MIADVFKLLEHVQNIKDVNISRALFVLYFPSKTKKSII